MKCLKNKQIIEYMDKTLNGVEYSLTRDHILSCDKCRQELRHYELLEKNLEKVELKEPPAEIEQFVMKKLFPRFSHIASLITLIAASFMLLIAGIYVYFDFANDSMIKAFHLTRDQATSIISSTVKFISVIFSGMLTIFKAINALLEALLNVRIGVEVTGTIFAFFLITISYLVYNKIFLKLKDSRQNR
ncbi:MAG: hypothetical protein ABFR36_02610 [Acidobacteriota bacterium]